MPDAQIEVQRLGRLGYAEALEVQRRVNAEVLAGRADGAAHRILLVEHPPTITVTRRPGSAEHVLADPARLAALGVALHETDRGGDVTYHGPGQVVAYPVLDLQRLGLGIHAYIRALEQAAIAACARWGVACHPEEGATGVWTGGPGPAARKIAAIGVRVSRSVAMHGIALNVDPDMSHFGLIVPCGLHGRRVTSLRAEAGGGCPSFADAADALAAEIAAAVTRPSAKAP